MEGKIVVLKKTREIPVKMRHPWIYSGAISRVSGNPYPGDVVLVMSYKKRAPWLWLVFAKIPDKGQDVIL